MFRIPIFVGISERFRVVEGLTANSILKNTQHPVEITHVYPQTESGCTGFSNVRFNIRKGIYLDCDMIVLGDIAELWEYHKPGKFVCLADGSTEVAVIDCYHECRNKHQVGALPLSRDIPLIWNCEDRCQPGMKLLHFTSLKTQPWFHNHPNADAVSLYEQYKPDNNCSRTA